MVDKITEKKEYEIGFGEKYNSLAKRHGLQIVGLSGGDVYEYYRTMDIVTYGGRWHNLLAHVSKEGLAIFSRQDNSRDKTDSYKLRLGSHLSSQEKDLMDKFAEDLEKTSGRRVTLVEYEPVERVV